MTTHCTHGRILGPNTKDTNCDRQRTPRSPPLAQCLARSLHATLCPFWRLQELQDTPKEDTKKKAIEVSARLIREMKAMCQGAHIMPLGWDDTVAPIVDAATA